MINAILKNNKYILIPFWIWIFFIFWLQVVPQVESILEATLFCVLLTSTIFPFSHYLSGHLLIKAIQEKNFKKFGIQYSFISLIVGLVFLFYINLFKYLEQVNVFPDSLYFDVASIMDKLSIVTISAGFIINITICGLRFFLEYLKSQKILNEYQLQTLQHQLTPHFMFNVLNHIHILMQSDVTLASDLLIKYSDILRYQLYSGDKKEVTLEKDIRFIKDFIAIEELRWVGKLTVNTSWKIENPEKILPPLLFITFVENAFKYVSKSSYNKGYITIKFEQKENRIDFQIDNSLFTVNKKKKEEDEGGLGLKNIKQRLDILYFNNYKLSISETEEMYQVKLHINI